MRKGHAIHFDVSGVTIKYPRRWALRSQHNIRDQRWWWSILRVVVKVSQTSRYSYCFVALLICQEVEVFKKYFLLFALLLSRLATTTAPQGNKYNRSIFLLAARDVAKLRCTWKGLDWLDWTRLWTSRVFHSMDGTHQFNLVVGAMIWHSLLLRARSL